MTKTTRISDNTSIVSIIQICRESNQYRSGFMVSVPPRVVIRSSFWGLVCVAIIISVSLSIVIYHVKEANEIYINSKFIGKTVFLSSKLLSVSRKITGHEIAFRWNYETTSTMPMRTTMTMTVTMTSTVSTICKSKIVEGLIHMNTKSLQMVITRNYKMNKEIR